MINTAPTVSNSVYGGEKLFWYDKINFSNHRVTVVQWTRSCLPVQINRVWLPATLFSVSFYRFFFFPVWSPAFFFLSSYFWACRSCTRINDILSLSPEYYFGKEISKALDLHTGQAWDQIKTISPVKTCPASETAEFFPALVDIMTNNTQYTTNCTHLHPTPNTHQWPTGES